MESTYNYMRPTASLFLLFASFAIVLSYAITPRTIDPTVLKHYHHYWHLLASLLAVVSAYLIFAFYVEHPEKEVARYHHLSAMISIMVICWLMICIVKLALVVM